MQAKTHIIGGVAGAAALCLIKDINAVQALPMAAAGAMGALLPDIDVPGSYLSRTSFGVRSMSGILTLIFGHRGFFHSLLFTGAMWLTMRFILMPRFTLLTSNLIAAFIIGMLSHLVLDSMTYGGIAWFWPFNLRFSLPFQTGGLFERIFRLALILFCIYAGANIIF